MIRKHVAEVQMAERELGAWTQIHNVEIICSGMFVVRLSWTKTTHLEPTVVSPSPVKYLSRLAQKDNQTSVCSTTGFAT